MLAACNTQNTNELKPDHVTSSVNYDSDDPAIWINPQNPEASLILGTDKKENGLGGIFVFDLEGKEDTTKRIKNIDRPNNIDVAYGLKINDSTITDIAVFTERGKEQIRVYSLPSLKAIDNGGIPVFADSENKAVMGVALYTRAEDQAIFAIVSRKGENAPSEGYLYQYLLSADTNGVVSGELVRKFGKFSGGTGEIEAIAVDNELGFIYYSDEAFGIRKYYANPEKGNEELASFGQNDFKEDREGISIYKQSATTGYILVSNQQNHSFNVYPREGSSANKHEHKLLKSIPVQARESDGSDVTALPLSSTYPKGLFVAMSDNKTFEIYSWEKFDNILNAELVVNK